MIEALIQVWIAVAQGASFYLLARTDKWQRWGYPVGLAAQPGYLYACTVAEQWGMLALTAWVIWQLGRGAKARFLDA